MEKIDSRAALSACEAALAVDPENPRLLFEMGRSFQASGDFLQARIFYARAAAHGHGGGQNNLGVFYKNGIGGLPKNDERAARLFRLAADKGIGTAQTNLGDLYVTGRGGLEKNEQEAARLYELASEQGIAPAQERLGALYAARKGGSPKNDREAVRLFRLCKSGPGGSPVQSRALLRDWPWRAPAQ